MGIQLGDVPTWLAGVGTVGALWYTAVTVRRDKVLRETGDAKHVSAWPDKRVQSGPIHEGLKVRMAGTYPVICIRNGGDEPVYEVKVLYTVGKNGDDSLSKPGPSERRKWSRHLCRSDSPPARCLWQRAGEASDTIELAIMPPGQTVDREVPRAKGEPAVVAIYFVDAAGRSWKRDASGRLALTRKARRREA